MTVKQKLRIVTDTVMLIFLLLAYNPRLARGTYHMFIGITLFILFAVHVYFNRKWFSAVFKGAYTSYRIFITIINILLAITAAAMIISGILEANWKPYFSNFESGINIRQIHTIAAYWFIPIAGIHLGLHWGMFTKYISAKRSIIIITRILAVLFLLFGIWSFTDRDMFSKMFLGFSFDYYPAERPVILFYVQTLSIMGIFVFTAYCLLKLNDILKTINKKYQTEEL
ncbi:MAG: DUF4405 domain-containing protein [Treponema sp.]|nr:DUF4405 domain-containing protein [Treponema sp.]